MSSRIADFCVRHTIANGPCTLDQLADAARAGEVTHARDPRTSIRNAISDDRRLLLLPGERWACGLNVLEGAVLTHRVRSGTAGRDLLFAGRELAPLATFVERGPLR
ncbi:MAG: hypothetical protein ACRDVZ_08550, partial [Jiangellaceae bacterium]